MRTFRIYLVTFLIAFVLTCVWLFTPPDSIEQPTTDYLDMHVHAAGLGHGDSGAFINEEMARSYKFPIYLWAMGVSAAEIEKSGDQLVIQRISAEAAESERVTSVIVLAMDGVIDDDGELDRARTQLYVPNDFVAREVARYANLEFGASVNPNRPDAIARLRAAKSMGARLIKWIPNIMLVDPADPAHTPFYEEMAALGLPLLSHAGQERSFAGAADEYGDPLRLRLALETGVTVIAAHVATTGVTDGEENFTRLLPLFDEFPNLYTDISSLTQINKLNYLARALQVEGLQERMLYGTDWPLRFFPLVSPLYHLNHIELGDARTVLHLDNIWDKDVALKEAFGVPPSVFERSRSLLLR